MEDKKVLEFINENHERAYKDFVKSQKRKNRIETFKISILAGALIIGMIALAVTVHNDTKKSIENCINAGNTYEYCLVDAQ